MLNHGLFVKKCHPHRESNWAVYCGDDWQIGIFHTENEARTHMVQLIFGLSSFNSQTDRSLHIHLVRSLSSAIYYGEGFEIVSKEKHV